VFAGIHTNNLALFDEETGDEIGRLYTYGDIRGEFLVRSNYLVLGNSGQVPLSELLSAGGGAGDGFADVVVEVDGVPDPNLSAMLNRGQVYNIAILGSMYTYGSSGNGSTAALLYEFSDEVRVVPEPSTYALCGAGLLVLALRRRVRA